jgi:hypothetical protein
MLRALLVSTPLWAIMLVTITLLLLAIELGFRTGGYRKDKRNKEGNSQVISLTGAHLGLLAFILAFSFSMSAGHFGKRKELVLEEVNAIETAHLRAELVGEPHRTQIKTLLADYTVARAASQNADATTIARFISDSEAIQANIWTVVEQLSQKDKVTVMDSLLVQAINEVLDLHNDRIYAGLNSRIPINIWAALYVILILSMTGMGFSMGLSGNRSPVSSMSLALSFSMVMFVIADLDRPTSGLVQTDQSLMIKLSKQLNPS